jgi:uncharacterized protein (TIGR02246 family)
MRLSSVLAGLVIAGLASTALANDKTTIEAINAKFMDAVAKKQSVAEFYTDDAVTLPDKAEMLKGRDAIAAYWAEGSKVMTDFKLVTVDVQMLGPDALREIGTYSVKMTGAPGEDVGKYLVIWRKQGTDWKIDSDIWNTNK